MHRKLLLLSLAVGTAAGGAAVLLQSVIRWIRTGLNALTGSAGNGWMVLVLPGIGMLLSLIFCKYIIKDNIGHGVTKALVAVSKNDSRIRPHNMWSSVLASGVTIGFGGSVGAEAPIVYTGAAIGSNLGRYMGLSYRGMTLLLGCGAAGISMTSMIPLLLSTVSATVVSYLFLGPQTPFQCTLSAFTMRNIPFYILLGLFCGACSIYFIRTTLGMEDWLGKLRNRYVKWALCSLGLGVLLFLFPPLWGEGYDSLGVLLQGGELGLEGSSPLSFMLEKPVLVPVLFLLILLLKVFSMTFTNAGGGVGGTFGPTLFVGAIAGFVLARTLNLLSLDVPEQNFVLVGMAGLMAGVMQAPMTAIFLIAEISGGYELLVPLILTSAVSFGATRLVEKYSIYTKRIAMTGELLTHDSDQAVLTLLKLDSLVEKDFQPVRIDDTLGSLVEAVSSSQRNLFPVLDEKQHFQGCVSLEDIRRDMFQTQLYASKHVFNYMHSVPAYIYEGENMESVMNKFETTGAWNLPVVKEDRTYVGFVSKSKIFSAYRDELRLVSAD